MEKLEKAIRENSTWEIARIIYGLPFSIERFKMLPYNTELEVMIGKDGTVYYARPSHQEFLIEKAVEKEKCTRDELFDMCPAEYHCRFMNWLIDISGGFIPVWRKFFVANELTKEQQNALKKLKLAGLYKGNITMRKRTHRVINGGYI